MTVLPLESFDERFTKNSTASVVLNGHYVPPPKDENGKIWIRTSVLVQRSPLDLYKMWRDVESAPLWQEHIVKVVRTGPATSRWSMKTSNRDDSEILSWDSEVLADEPGERIAWRSIGGDSLNAGEVIFEEAVGGRGTLVTVLQEFEMGKFASAWETLMSRDPKQSMIEGLRHFKALAETGEIPRTQLDPHGKRGRIEQMKQALYGETVPTPPGKAGSKTL